MPIDFQWLRSPFPEHLWTLTERPGFLRLFGRETVGSQFEQALVARRQQACCFTAATRMEFQPEHFQQAAGLILYYHATKFHYLFLTEDETIGRHLRVMSCVTDVGDSFSAPMPLPAGTGNIELRMDVDYERLIFAYRLPGQAWQALPQVFDASIVSDEAGPPILPNFTGAFAGVCCQDGAGTRRPADFDLSVAKTRPRPNSRVVGCEARPLRGAVQYGWGRLGERGSLPSVLLHGHRLLLAPNIASPRSDPVKLPAATRIGDVGRPAEARRPAVLTPSAWVSPAGSPVYPFQEHHACGPCARIENGILQFR